MLAWRGDERFPFCSTAKVMVAVTAFARRIGDTAFRLDRRETASNTTGRERIQAGVPAGWRVADKTGTGDYGATNDIGIVFPPQGPPVVIAIYYTGTKASATGGRGVQRACGRWPATCSVARAARPRTRASDG